MNTWAELIAQAVNNDGDFLDSLLYGAGLAVGMHEVARLGVPWCDADAYWRGLNDGVHKFRAAKAAWREYVRNQGPEAHIPAALDDAFKFRMIESTYTQSK